MKPRVFIDGDQGTTGLQIMSRLSARDDLNLLTLPAETRKNPQARAEAINRCDIAILCLPLRRGPRSGFVCCEPVCSIDRC
jgi:N-acetyl-gamma-glutamyl-phosphate reductase